MVGRIPNPIIFFVSVGLCLVVCMLGCETADARTITVDDDGGADHERIQDAIEDASDGDMIRVFDGVYYENIKITKSVSLVGNGSETTIIDGGRKGHVVKVSTLDVVIQRLRIQNGWNGIYVETGSATIVENEISNNNYNGIYLVANGNSVRKNTITLNQGSGIRFDDADRNIIEENNINQNDDGLYMWRSRNNIIMNNSLSGNNIHFSQSSVEDYISNDIDTSNIVNGYSAYFIKNASGTIEAGIGGQYILANCSSLKILDITCRNSSVGVEVVYSSNVTIRDAVTTACDTGIRIEDSENIRVEDTQCINGEYGLWVDNTLNCIVENSRFLDNSRSGIRIRNSDHLFIQSTNCSGNGDTGLAINGGSYGKIMDSTFIWNDDGLSISGHTSVHVTSSVFNSNQDSGIYLYSNPQIAQIEDNSISENRVGINIWQEWNVEIHRNLIYDNLELGIRVSYADGRQINADNNWWGDNSGPYHHGLNPQGKGDIIVYDNLDFEPWMEISEESPSDNDLSDNVVFTLLLIILVVLVVMLGSLLFFLFDGRLREV